MCPGDESADISATELEFRSTADDAWYIVQVVLQTETFVVKFSEFPESIDKRVSAADFQTLQAVHDFVRRFRPFSVQLQDNQCSKIVKGLTVCAPFKFKHHDIRFYDAVVESVSLTSS
ncbi:uncharacterized protein LOC132309671 [Cornus florida]|uniref:uncharacterized protein LOC132309671 n=1 Tax=Cornus florida TaxID=4283 RepID=UPI00289CD35B|nr:uncharacterized protein LOC132309671 [Cornus florida]